MLRVGRGGGGGGREGLTVSYRSELQNGVQRDLNIRQVLLRFIAEIRHNTSHDGLQIKGIIIIVISKW